ncbi:unnamed protein product [Trichogramma brassicae]|uniref:Uncharacterized protein n=1 Tax=Trichogramma brassicae TaxID=86971 RepID=A0A6H5IEH3_9HYME|nr:unnamed protein product [Trichogramma brassicae]
MAAPRSIGARNHLESQRHRVPRARLDLHASSTRGSGRHRACVAHAQRTSIFRKPHANIAGYYKIPTFEFIVALCEPMIDAVKASYFPYRLVYSLSTRHYKRTRTYVYRRVSRFSSHFLKTARMFTRLFVDDFFPWNLSRSVAAAAAAATAAVKLLGSYKMANRGGKNQSSMQLATTSYTSTRGPVLLHVVRCSIWMVAQNFPIKAANSSYCGRSNPVPLLQRQPSFFIAQYSNSHASTCLYPLQLLCACSSAPYTYGLEIVLARDSLQLGACSTPVLFCAVHWTFKASRLVTRVLVPNSAIRRRSLDAKNVLCRTCITSTRTYACIISGSYKLFCVDRFELHNTRIIHVREAPLCLPDTIATGSHGSRYSTRASYRKECFRNYGRRASAETRTTGPMERISHITNFGRSTISELIRKYQPPVQYWAWHASKAQRETGAPSYSNNRSNRTINHDWSRDAYTWPRREGNAAKLYVYMTCSSIYTPMCKRIWP